MINDPSLRATELRKVSLLRSLGHMNTRGYNPRMGELIRFDDHREAVPRNTVTFRRKLIKDMVARGYISWVNDASGHPVRLHITHAGRNALADMDK